MKVRHGFVSNSSSSSFLIVLDESNRHLAHYNHLITEEETAWDETKTIYVDDDWSKPPKEIDTAEYFIGAGFTKVGKRYDREIWERTRPISNTVDTGVGRATSICFGEELKKYVEVLKEDNYTPALLDAIENAIKEHGAENVMLLRESDEGMGGSLPKELRALTKKAIYKGEYH